LKGDDRPCGCRERAGFVSYETTGGRASGGRLDPDERTRFPFTASEVVRVYTRISHPAHDGDGLWFQIKGGKIFNCLGQRERKRKSCFSEPIEGDEARDLAAFAIVRLNGFQPTDYSAEGEAE
jgi:hypothetical protein